jgi:hypothetical protein
MEPEGALACAQEPATCSCIVPDNSSPRPHTVLVSLKIQFNIITSSRLDFSSCLFLHCVPGCISYFSVRATCPVHPLFGHHFMKRGIHSVGMKSFPSQMSSGTGEFRQGVSE